MVGGDFNVIASWDEKKGGRMVDDGSMVEFNSFIIQSGLIDISTNNSSLSWTNNQQGNSRIYKKLDRILVNSETLIKVPSFNCVYLPRVQSDHMPILFSLGKYEGKAGGFKFLRMWSDHEEFQQFVKNCWQVTGHANGLVNIQVKLKFLKSQLKDWNRKVFGHVDRNIDLINDNIQVMDVQLANRWDDEVFRNLQEEKEKLSKWENRKYGLLEDKARLHWLKGGDRNTKVFHAAIRDQARKNKISLKLEDGSVTDDPVIIGEIATKFFSDLYKGERYFHNDSLFSSIPRLISREENDKLTIVPQKEEIKAAVYNLNPSSAPGPDGFGGYFY